jgi:hypothetical protein
MADKKWWGYIHVDGSLHAKVYFDEKDLNEAYGSPFVGIVFPPITGTREDIIKLMENPNDI